MNEVRITLDAEELRLLVAGRTLTKKGDGEQVVVVELRRPTIEEATELMRALGEVAAEG